VAAGAAAAGVGILLGATAVVVGAGLLMGAWWAAADVVAAAVCLGAAAEVPAVAPLRALITFKLRPCSAVPSKLRALRVQAIKQIASLPCPQTRKYEGSKVSRHGRRC
jgi:hypothetical protein